MHVRDLEDFTTLPNLKLIRYQRAIRVYSICCHSEPKAKPEAGRQLAHRYFDITRIENELECVVAVKV